jgi:hypothetical protein
MCRYALDRLIFHQVDKFLIRAAILIYPYPGRMSPEQEEGWVLWAAPLGRHPVKPGFSPHFYGFPGQKWKFIRTVSLYINYG